MKILMDGTETEVNDTEKVKKIVAILDEENKDAYDKIETFLKDSPAVRNDEERQKIISFMKRTDDVLRRPETLKAAEELRRKVGNVPTEVLQRPYTL